MSILVFPVGLLVGTYHDEGHHHHEVRLGGRIHELTDTDLAAWLFAHGRPDATSAVDDAPWTTTDLLRHLAEQRVPHPAALVDTLLRRGLLVEVASNGDHVSAFASTHTVVPIMHGLGNSPEEPWLYSIGLLGQGRIQVSRVVFDVWAWGHLDGDLWRACTSVAALERADGDTDPATTDPANVLAGFLTTLHGLLGAQAAYVDVVEADRSEAA